MKQREMITPIEAVVRGLPNDNTIIWHKDHLIDEVKPGKDELWALYYVDVQNPDYPGVDFVDKTAACIEVQNAEPDELRQDLLELAQREINACPDKWLIKMLRERRSNIARDIDFWSHMAMIHGSK